MPRIRPELLRAAKFRASRNGLRGELIDILGRRSQPASEAVETFLEFLRPALESAGEWEEITTLVFDTFARGNGADRQRAAYARGGRFEDVVDLILEETSRGT
jgi:carboxylate-amine ligase